eukprot:gene11129-12965_t
MKNQKTLIFLLSAGLLLLFCLPCCKTTGRDTHYAVNQDSVNVHKISLDSVKVLMANMKRERRTLQGQLKQADYLAKSFDIPEAEKFNKDAVLALLNQKGAKGFRIYLGKDGKGKVCMILVGVDAMGKDILPKRKTGQMRIQSFSSESDEEGLLMEAGQRCPTIQSVLLPILVAALRLRKGNYTIYIPFLTLIGIAFLSEICSLLMIQVFHKSNAISINIYSLLECWLVLLQFYLWGFIKNRKMVFLFLTVLCTGVWAAENLIAGQLFLFRPYFRIFYAFIIVLLSINQINALLVHYQGSLFKNSKFLLSLAFMIFFIYQIIYEASFYIGYNKFSLANMIILFFGYLNFFVNRKLEMEDRVIHTLLTVSLIIAVIIAFFIISIIRYHRRYIALQKERINAEIIMQESERKRIANDLHDSLGPLLSAVKLNIQSLEVQAGEDQFIVEKAGQHIDEIIESLREISYNLLPNTLNRKGLSDAVEEYLYRISSSQNIKIKFDLKGINLIDKKKEIHLFRIIQEIVHNVIKHSGATEMQIYSQQKTSELNLYLKDNGLGFEPEQVSKVSSGLGLKSIESRCELIGALCELNTSSAMMLSRQANFRLCGQVSNGQQLLELIAIKKPDVVLTDIKMPILDGIETTKVILQKFPEIKVIALSMFDEEKLIIEMLEAGASGYLLKNAHKNEIIDAVVNVYEGKNYYCAHTSAMLAAMIVRSRFKASQQKEAITFTGRENEIIKLICQQYTAQQIADKIFLSKRTVEGHRVKIMEKINAKNMAGLVIFALKNGIITEEDIL